MIAALSGSLLSHDAMASGLHGSPTGIPGSTCRWFQTWYDRVIRELGPASSARVVYDRVAEPLAHAFGFRLVLAPGPTSSSAWIQALLQTDRGPAAALLVTPWGQDPATAWRAAVRFGIAETMRWCLCVTGPFVRIFDATRTYTRRFAQFDLEITAHDSVSLALFWRLLNHEAFHGSESALDRAVTASDQHRASVRASLQHGVEDALGSLLQAFAAAGRKTADRSALFDESLIVIYRILFLLFAEARGLVPTWHPIYRDSYTIESLRSPSEVQQNPAGLWESLQAISRLAHRGCRAGSLRVTPFNGRLFSPVDAPLADRLMLDDAAVRTAMLALTTRTSGAGRQRIAYADLGVEQLGGVYERILDFTPAPAQGIGRPVALQRNGRRKSTGTFYTPRALTDFMVRRALAPLVHDRTPEEVLGLRVVDPAMGSGAFLVAACRYLAAAYEAALIRGCGLSATDFDEHDRAGFRRTVAQRCLFGVDINPMAVQLGRLSLWLATLARERPLTFLDHHLRAGNSLVGASLEDVLRAPQRRAARRPAPQLPLFDLDLVDEELRQAVDGRLSLANDPGDTIEEVRSKERLLSSLRQPGAPLTTWHAVADLWCSHWFRGTADGRAPLPFASLVDELLGRGATLPVHISRPFLDQASNAAQREQFFHWPLEFPEAFHDADGKPLAHPGFDAVIGNPPWDMLRRDAGRNADAALTAFARESGTYSWQGEGHTNLYQLFLERAMRLVRTGGRLAMVLPSGLAHDHGCANLRRALLDRHAVDTFVVFENRDRVFPIHRSLKFLLLTATRGERTTTIPCRSGVRSLAVLESIPDMEDRHAVGLHRAVVEKLSGDQLVVPDVRHPGDAAILSRIAFRFPALAAPDGWNVHFGRELNATDDSTHFVAKTAANCLPVIGGRQIQPFAVDVGAACHFIAATTAARLLGSGGYRRSRLAYRDVAAATNRLTLIAAILPPNVVSTHTLFCLRGAIDPAVQLFLCGILNSFVANYLVRTRVGTHVSVSIIEQLPVPRPEHDSTAFHGVVDLCRKLIRSPSNAEALARLQGSVARLYELTQPEFQHVLDTFPLVSDAERAAALRCFARLIPTENLSDPA